MIKKNKKNKQECNDANGDTQKKNYQLLIQQIQILNQYRESDCRLMIRNQKNGKQWESQLFRNQLMELWDVQGVDSKRLRVELWVRVDGKFEVIAKDSMYQGKNNMLLQQQSKHGTYCCYIRYQLIDKLCNEQIDRQKANTIGYHSNIDNNEFLKVGKLSNNLQTSTLRLNNSQDLAFSQLRNNLNYPQYNQQNLSFLSSQKQLPAQPQFIEQQQSIYINSSKEDLTSFKDNKQNIIEEMLNSIRFHQQSDKVEIIEPQTVEKFPQINSVPQPEESPLTTSQKWYNHKFNIKNMNRKRENQLNGGHQSKWYKQKQNNIEVIVYQHQHDFIGRDLGIRQIGNLVVYAKVRVDRIIFYMGNDEKRINLCCLVKKNKNQLHEWRKVVPLPAQGRVMVSCITEEGEISGCIGSLEMKIGKCSLYDKQGQGSGCMQFTSKYLSNNITQTDQLLNKAQQQQHNLTQRATDKQQIESPASQRENLEQTIELIKKKLRRLKSIKQNSKCYDKKKFRKCNPSIIDINNKQQNITIKIDNKPTQRRITTNNEQHPEENHQKINPQSHHITSINNKYSPQKANTVNDKYQDMRQHKLSETKLRKQPIIDENQKIRKELIKSLKFGAQDKKYRRFNLWISENQPITYSSRQVTSPFFSASKNVNQQRFRQYTNMKKQQETKNYSLSQDTLSRGGGPRGLTKNQYKNNGYVKRREKNIDTSQQKRLPLLTQPKDIPHRQQSLRLSKILKKPYRKKINIKLTQVHIKLYKPWHGNKILKIELSKIMYFTQFSKQFQQIIWKGNQYYFMDVDQNQILSIQLFKQSNRNQTSMGVCRMYLFFMDIGQIGKILQYEDYLRVGGGQESVGRIKIIYQIIQKSVSKITHKNRPLTLSQQFHQQVNKQKKHQNNRYSSPQNSRKIDTRQMKIVPSNIDHKSYEYYSNGLNSARKNKRSQRKYDGSNIIIPKALRFSQEKFNKSNFQPGPGTYQIMSIFDRHVSEF